MNHSPSARVCIIGAGPSGLAAAKNCLQVGLTNIVVYEKNEQVGGNWVFSPRLSHSSVYETTHIISSKTLSQFADYPMPADYPDYPSHWQVLAYFNDYARAFGIPPYIRFNTAVEKAEEQPDKTWRITLGDGTVELFDYLIVANGHHWDPRQPHYPGQESFSAAGGELLHSHQYKSAEPFRDRRVLVIGGGNSACDIAVETGRTSAFTGISMRRGYYFSPKFLMGQPSDVMASRFAGLPHWLYTRAVTLSYWLSVGDHARYGLDKPKHGLLEGHVTLNSELLYFIRHGKVHPRKDIARFDGKTVHFTDGRAEDYDVVIAATGFNIRFPFFDPAFLDYSAGKPVDLYLLMLHPSHPSLFIVGLVQPLGAIWPLSDAQAQLAANAIIGNYTPPVDMRERIARDTHYRATHFFKSDRHTVEVEFFPFLRRLQREIPANAAKWTQPRADHALDEAPSATSRAS